MYLGNSFSLRAAAGAAGPCCGSGPRSSRLLGFHSEFIAWVQHLQCSGRPPLGGPSFLCSYMPHSAPDSSS